MKISRRFLFALLISPPALHAGNPAPALDAEFPGGNIAIQRIDGNRIYVAPDLRDTQQGQWWFYWNFALKSPPGNSATIVFSGKEPIGVRGPAASYDRGETWQWLGSNAVNSAGTNGQQAWSFDAKIPDGADGARFAFCPQYLESHLNRWLEKHRGDPSLRTGELCKSRKGRGVEMIRAGCLDTNRAKGVVLLTSRHHCCETMATYAMEGILEAALGDDELGRKWRENWEIIALPFMDKDGCEDGDQGKNRAPHDHNRDYNTAPLYPEVAALMKLGESLKGRVVATMDMHCPHIRGDWNDRVYIVGSSSPAFWEKQKNFAAVWARLQQGPIRFRAQDCLAYGTAWNTEANYKLGRSCSAWARDTFPGAQLSTGIEIAYADALGVEVNATTARALGRDIARAIASYLSSPP